MDQSVMEQIARLTNGKRLWGSLMRLAEIGAIEGEGSCRLSLTDEDKLARDLFADWIKDAGCELRVDQYGNMFAIRPGLDPDASVLLVGSHLDTQPHGGRFDGVLGVLAGLEIVRALNDAGINTRHPIAVVNWTNEEGVRFKPGLTGSKGFTGVLDEEKVSGVDGASYFHELSRIGYAGAPLNDIRVGAYYELHIEQGPVLEAAEQPIGIVDGIQGVRWFEIELIGEDAHAGTTPMKTRRDSFMAASVLATQLRAAAQEISPELRFTVGRVEVTPNSTNTIPGRTVLHVDLRHGQVAILNAFEQLMKEEAVRIQNSEGIGCQIRCVMEVPPVRFDPRMQEGLQSSCRSLGVVPFRLPSGAMHDASSLASVAPTAMIFVQSRDGISHNPAEWSEPEHIALACEVLAQTVLKHADPTG